MNKYELTIVLDGKATKAQVKEKTDFIGKLVKLAEGKIISTDDWGVKNLYFQMGPNKTTVGFFTYFELELEPSSIKNINEKLRLEDGIIRYLLIKPKIRNGKKS